MTDTNDSTFVLTGAAVVAGDQIVVPTETMVQFDDSPLWNEDAVLASRPSEDHYLVWAAVWVHEDVLSAS